MASTQPNDLNALLAAANADDASARLDRIWRGGAYVRWAAPEVLNPAQFNNVSLVRATTEADVWALACTAVEFCTLKVPLYQIRDDGAVRARVLAGERAALPVHYPAANAGVAAAKFVSALKSMLEKCWFVRPEGRPRAEEIASALQAAIQPDSSAFVLGNSERSEKRRSWLGRRR